MSKPPEKGEGMRQLTAFHGTLLAEKKNVLVHAIRSVSGARVAPLRVSGRVELKTRRRPVFEGS